MTPHNSDSATLANDLARCLSSGAVVGWGRSEFSDWEWAEALVEYGTWSGLDALELGERVFPFMENENIEHRWHREAWLGEKPQEWIVFA